MSHALAGAPFGLVARAWKVIAAWLLLALFCLVPIAPAFAAEQAPGPAVPQGAAERRGEGPRNPYDMKALRQFDAGSHRAEQPRVETTQPPEGSGS